jgi:7,8-dihydropterin-6-yl-methyl-4-(beta-D-ribofuranosyl)aminobenzene 5'-phosphate synthase
VVDQSENRCNAQQLGISLQRDRLQATAEILRKYQVQIIGANHCTGMAAIACFWHELAGKCIICPVGTRLKFGN